MMKKRLLFYISLLLIYLMVGCTGEVDTIKVDLFNEREATRVGRIYMDELCKGQENYINAFKLDHSSEGGNFIFLNYIVTRGNDKGDSIGLDSYDLKVIKNAEVYSVKEVKAKNTKQVYVDNNTLRILDQDVGESQLFLRRKDLPKEIYSKGNELMIDKEKVPQGEFSMLAIGFEGNKVALVVKSENKEFIALAMAKESTVTVAKESKGDSSDVKNTGTDILIERPTVEKIIPYDLIKDSNIEKLVFTNDDAELIVQINSKGVSSLKSYRNPSGELIPIDLESRFPKDKYQIKIDRVNEVGNFIKIIAIDSGEEEEYSLDLKEMKVKKINK